MVHVTSEVGRLRRVIVHDPGPEVDLMIPSMMEELLFDDILFGDHAREEHGRFRRLLQVFGVDVVEANGLLEETLDVPAARSWLAQVLGGDQLELRELLEGTPSDELTRLLVAGKRQVHSESAAGVGELFSIAPLSNWCFQRDPQVIAYDGVIFTAMATQARWREALLTRAVFQFHPELGSTPIIADPLQAETSRPLFLGLDRPRLEGGDVLMMSPDVMLVGISQRTNTVALSMLIRAMTRREGGPRWLLAVHLPRRRAYMHLDTVFTPVDQGSALVFPPILGGPEAAHVYETDLHAENPVPLPAPPLFEAMRRRGVALEPLPCGGDDPVSQHREQWTDGANALALAPGVIILYDRNVRTAEMLSDRGFDVVEAEAVLLGRAEIDLDEPKRTCLLLSSHEISRARGGPHCLTHPLERDDL